MMCIGRTRCLTLGFLVFGAFRIITPMGACPTPLTPNTVEPIHTLGFLFHRFLVFGAFRIITPMGERERERARVGVCVRERECVSVCVCVRERERVCVFVRVCV